MTSDRPYNGKNSNDDNTTNIEISDNSSFTNESREYTPQQVIMDVKKGLVYDAKLAGSL